MIACLSVDVEHDCPPYLTTWQGVEQGLPRSLAGPGLGQRKLEASPGRDVDEFLDRSEVASILP